jgi:hypothetical protein
MRSAYKILVGKPEGRSPFRRSVPRLEGNIKMDLEEIGLWCVDLIDLAQDRDRWQTVVKTAMKLRVP